MTRISEIDAMGVLLDEAKKESGITCERTITLDFDHDGSVAAKNIEVAYNLFVERIYSIGYGLNWARYINQNLSFKPEPSLSDSDLVLSYGFGDSETLNNERVRRLNGRV